MFESGIVQHHDKIELIKAHLESFLVKKILKILYLLKTKSKTKLNIKLSLNLDSKSTFELANYDDITFDAIKRGPLLLIIIGLVFACFCFALEIIVFFTK